MSTRLFTKPRPIATLHNWRRLPVELYREIFEHLTSTRDMHNLRLVTRAIQIEVDKMIYPVISLRSHWRCILSWSQAIISNARLALLIRSLTIPSYSTFVPLNIVMETELTRIFARALNAVKNLKELYIYPPESLDVGSRYLEPWVFQGCSFRLRVYHHPARKNIAGFPPFLPHQPDIQYWKSGYTDVQDEDEVSFTDDVLPSVSAVDICSLKMLTMLARRPVRFLVLRCTLSKWETLRLGLQPLASSLRSLTLKIDNSYVDHLGAGSKFLRVMKFMGNMVPGLRFLSLDVDMLFSSFTFNEYLDHMSTLKRLKIFKLALHAFTEKKAAEMRRVSPDYSERNYTYLHSRLLFPESSHSAAEQIISRCSSLEQVAFMLKGVWVDERFRWYVDRRDGSGRVSFEGIDLSKEESWRDV